MKRNYLISFLIAAFFFVGYNSAIAAYENEPVTVSWAMDTTSPENNVTCSLDDVMMNMDFSATISILDTRSTFGNTVVRFQPNNNNAGTAQANDAVSFKIIPAFGYTFTPTNISFKSVRYGTDGGKLQVSAVNGNGSETVLQDGIVPNRDNGTEATSTSINITDMTASADGFELKVYVYSLGNTKQVAIYDVVISGTISGERANLEKYSLQTKMNIDGAGTITTSPRGDSFDEGTAVTLTAAPNFGYRFVNWTDGQGDVLSSAASFTHTVSADIEITANFEALSTYYLDLQITGGANDYLVQLSDEGTMVEGKRMYEEGTTVQLTASSNRIVKFANWENNDTNSVRNITMSQDMNVTANYSAEEFIVGWDFLIDEPKSGRGGDYYADSENQGMFSLRKEDGTTGSWLSKGLTGGLYEGRHGVVNWNTFSTSDNYYYEISFSTLNFTKVAVQAAMLYNYNAFTIQKVEYSLDGTTYASLGQFELAANKVWYDKSFDLPESAWNQARVYVRFIPDYTSPVAGTTSNNDGTAMADVYVLGESSTVGDETPPVLTSSIPQEGSMEVSTSGSIILTFDERIIAGTGKATLNGEDLEMTTSGNTAFFKYFGLPYLTAQTFTIPAGVITDRNGNAYEGTTITFTTMDRPAATPALFDYVVKANDADDLKAALKAANSASGANRYRIFVPAGDYNLGNVALTSISRSNVSLIGEDMEKTIIRNLPPSSGISSSATILIADGTTNTYLQDITLKNDWDYASSPAQAVCLQDKGNKTILKNVKMLSFQDTYYSNNNSMRSYMEDCRIHGTVDFICGGGDVFFNRLQVYLEERSGNVIVAPNGTPEWGYVFSDCTIDGTSTNNNSYNLGRPWGGEPKAVYINTLMKVVPRALGWTDMSVAPKLFAEYNSYTTSGPVDTSNRKTSYKVGDDNVAYTGPTTLTAEQAARYTIANVLGGTDSWTPQVLTEQNQAPEIVLSGTTLSWESNIYALCYIVMKDGAYYTQTTDNSLTVDPIGKYTVYAANEMGGLSNASNAVGQGSDLGEVGKQSEITWYVDGGILYLSNLPENARVELYNFLGQKHYQAVTNSGSTTIALPESGIVRIWSAGNTETFKVIKR